MDEPFLPQEQLRKSPLFDPIVPFGHSFIPPARRFTPVTYYAPTLYPVSRSPSRRSRTPPPPTETVPPPSSKPNRRLCGCNCRADCPCNCSCKCSCLCKENFCEGACEQSPKESRILVVSIDGTSNQFGIENTNVVELHSRIIKDRSVTHPQITYYNSGIGTYAPPSFRSFSYWKQVVINKIDLAIAWNFEKIVQNAYRWIADHYQNGDRIFFFGFSRGAYQVRALAAMIHKVGLVYPGNQEQIPFAYELYANKYKGKATNRAEQMARHFKKTFSRNVNVHFVGAWDTVSSVGIVRGKPLPHTGLTDHLCFFRHALALDERRVKFLPEYVDRRRSETDGQQAAMSQDLDERAKGGKVERAERPHIAKDMHHVHAKEVWFAGSHSDIGGGNRQNLSLDLAGVPLLWMENEAMAAGLKLELRSSGVVYNLEQKQSSRSLSGIWWVLEWLPLKRLMYGNGTGTTRIPHAGKGRIIADGQRIHSSVAFQNRSYRPEATFAKNGIKWGSIVNTGNNKDMDWAKNLVGVLEMDVFDPSFVAHIVGELRDGTTSDHDLVRIIDRLFFIAFSTDGARAIVKAHGITDLIQFLQNQNPNIQASSADCLSQLAKHRKIRRSIIHDHIDVVLQNLMQMLQNNDIQVVLGIIDCLSQLAQKDDEASPVTEFLKRIKEAILHSDIPVLLFRMLQDNDKDVQHRCANFLSRLVQHNDIRIAILELGVFPLLADMLQSKDGKVREAVVASLAELAQYDDTHPRFDLHTVRALARSLQSQDFGIRCHSAACLSRLATYVDHRTTILSVGLISELVCMLGSNDPAVRNVGLTHLPNIADNGTDIRAMILQTDAILVLSRMLDSSETQLSSASSISQLAKHDDLRGAILRTDTIPIMVKLVNSKDTQLRSAGINHVLQLVQHSDTHAAILETDMLMRLLRMFEKSDTQVEAGLFLRSLATHEDLRSAILLHTGVMLRLSDMLNSSNKKIRKAAMENILELVQYDNIRSAVLQADMFSVLPSMLEKSDTRVKGALFIRDLVIHEDLRGGIIRAGAIMGFFNMLNSSNTKVHIAAMGHIRYMIRYDDIRAAILQISALSVLVTMLGKPHARLSAAVFILELSEREDLRHGIIHTGAIPSLFNVLDNGEESVIYSDILVKLAEHGDVQAAILEANVLPALIKMLDKPHARSSFVSPCALLAKHDNLRPVIMREGAIVGFFNMLTSDDVEVHMAAFGHILDLIKYDDTRLAILEASTLSGVIKMLEKPHTRLRTASFFAGLAKHEDLRHGIIRTGALFALFNTLNNSDESVGDAAIESIVVLAQHDDIMVAVEDADLFSALVSMLDSCDTQSHAASYILQLAKHENLRTAILGTEVVSALVQMLHGDNPTARKVGIETLLKLAECDGTKALIIGEVMPVLAKLLRHSNAAIRFSSTMALVHFRTDSDGRAAVLKESIFLTLVGNLENEDEYLVVKTACAIVLRCFSEYEDFRTVILQMDLISIIVRMLKTTEPLVPLYDGLVLIGMPHYDVPSLMGYIGNIDMAVLVLCELGKHDDALPQILRAHTIETTVDHLLLSSDVLEFHQTYGAHLLKELAQKDEARATMLSMDSIRTLVRMRDRNDRGSAARATAAATLAELMKYDNAMAWIKTQPLPLQTAVMTVKDEDWDGDSCYSDIIPAPQSPTITQSPLEWSPSARSSSVIGAASGSVPDSGASSDSEQGVSISDSDSDLSTTE